MSDFDSIKCSRMVGSYLSDRTQVVSVEGVFSNRDKLHWNVPQGTVLAIGSDQYSDYTAPVKEAVGTEVKDHYYADDSQLYNHFIAGNTESENKAANDIQETGGRVKS